MESNRELLLLAAKAAGIAIDPYYSEDLKTESGLVLKRSEFHPRRVGSTWNPLIDDGDSLRLAVKLRLNLHVDDYGAIARPSANVKWSACAAHLHSGIEAASRRVIVIAAAEIGRRMKDADKERK